MRQQLLEAIYAGRPRATVIDLGLTSHQVWGLTKTDEHWAAALEAALRASRCDDLKHGTNAAYVQGGVRSDGRAHQRIRMDRREQRARIIVRAGAVVDATEPEIAKSGPSLI
jgi:hypothetical protein